MIRFLSYLILLLTAALATNSPAEARGEKPGRFDHYVLSLSWSPTYCAGENGQRDRMQCSAQRAYAFIAHGLWPQYDQGWPEYCPTPESWIPNETIASMSDIMPSKGLIIHEWRRHGSCSGLDQGEYFALIRQLFTGIAIPAKYSSPAQDIVTTPQELIQDLVAANPAIDASMVGVYCGNRRDRAALSEVRICFQRDGTPMSCPEGARLQCRAKALVLPPVRPRNPS